MMPMTWEVSAHESDGQTWLCLKREDGVAAAISCKTRNEDFETIASQVVKEFSASLTAGRKARGVE